MEGGGGVGALGQEFGLELELDNVLANPKKYVGDLYDICTNYGESFPQGWTERLTETVSKVFEKSDVARLYREIPSLNVLTDEERKGLDGKVVRFRGMVQETFSPLISLTTVSVEDTVTGEVRKKCSVYGSNLMEMRDSEQVKSTSNFFPKTDLIEVEEICCVSLPGENQWVRDIDAAYMSAYDRNGVPRCKVYGIGRGDLKNTCVVASVYNKDHGLRLNEVVDFYGVLELPDAQDEDMGATIFANEDDSRTTGVGWDIVKIIVLGFKKNLCPEPPQLMTTVEQLGQLTLDADVTASARTLLLDLFEIVFAGDTLCARYVLGNMLSKMTARFADVAIGSFPLTILNVPSEVRCLVHEVLQAVLWKSIYIDGFFQRLDNDWIFPRMELETIYSYHSGKLFPGLLQITNGTQLILEELPFSPQEQRNLQNSAKAIKNLKAIEKLLECQAVDYEFASSQKHEFQHDVPILILSDSNKTLFRNTVEVPFEPAYPMDTFEEKARAKAMALLQDDSQMSMIRDFILRSQRRDVDFQISELAEDTISKDFAEDRKNTSPDIRMEVGDLSRAITFARHWLKYQGKTELTVEIWGEVQEMEKERKARLIKLKSCQQ